jgi:phosphoglycerol transferase MdoB-like AlkP superfamily enzyme
LVNHVAGTKPAQTVIETAGASDVSPRKLSSARILVSISATFILSAILVLVMEWIVRGSLDSALLFFQEPFRPSWTTVGLFALLITVLDAILGRTHHGLLVLGPVAVILAFVAHQKSLYLGDPLYPTDFLYARQIIELMPLLVSERPFTAVLIVVATVAAIALLFSAWRFWRRRFPLMSLKGRAVRLLVALPVLAFFVSIMDYASFSWVRDRLQISPMMWDQKENYASNGFAIAFALNLPMANVAAPAGFSAKAIDAIPQPTLKAAVLPDEKPDVIIVMSESFWDPTKLPGVTITPDPIANVRELQSGNVFSPEFGGMTANVEFEALTGFSNAFLPTGSIPYQQYVRKPLPSLATFFRSEGYATRAIHPFSGWFWNRTPVYEALGFEKFMSQENLPELAKRGMLVSDEALTEEIIRQADAIEEPFFFFTVTLQGHGPYAPNRYPDATHTVSSAASEATNGSIQAYAEGASDADKGLKRLVEWAAKRERPTVIAFFGDHLPPLGPAYVDTGFMEANVAKRRAPLDEMIEQHDTPLVIWSNRDGAVKDLGSISPAFLPLQVLKTAGIEHPYYTEFLGKMHEDYRVIDRNMLISKDGTGTPDWTRANRIDPALRDFRYLQHDLMFGKHRSQPAFFPETAVKDADVM